MRPTALLAALLATLALAPAARAQAFFSLAGDGFTAPVTSLRDMPFRTVVRQQYDYSCGSAALATLLRFHYGRPMAEAEVFQSMFAVGDQAKIRKVGFSLLDMKSYLATLGLRADGYRMTLGELARSDTPSIALITVAGYRHFVVVKGVRRGRILVGDPAQGLKSYDAQAFAKVWNGVVFAIHSSREATYNSPGEWGVLTPGPFNALDDTSLASFTRDLPPFSQVLALPLGAGTIR